MRLHTADRAATWRIPMLTMLVLATAGLAVGACGGSKSTSSSAASAPVATTSTPAATASTPAATASTPAATAPAGALALAANSEGQLKYSTAALTAKAGSVAIAFTNMAPLAHNLTVASSSGAVVGATPTFNGGSKTLALTLKAGTYKFYCTVPGHRQAGMEGTLVVK